MTTTTKYTDPQTTAYWQRVEAMFAFCDGFTTEQLRAGSLGELVGALRAARAHVLDVCEHNERINGHRSEMDRADLEKIDAALAPFKGGNDEA